MERRGECYKGGREGSVGCGGEMRRVLNRGREGSAGYGGEKRRVLNRGREGSAGYGGEKRTVLNRNKGRERWIWWREEDSVK